MATATDIIESLQAVLQTEVVTTAFVLGLGLLVFIVFISATTVGAYATALTWAGYESRFADGDEDKFEFDENRIIAIVALQLTALWDAFAALVATVISVGRGLAQSIAQNILLLLVLLLTFIFVVIWDTYHPILLQSYAELYSCFLAPVVRTLGLPIVNTYSLFLSLFPPILNFIRQVWSSVSTLSLLDSAICAGATTIEIVSALIASYRDIFGGFIMWIRSDPNSPSLLDVGPQFAPAFGVLGDAIVMLKAFTDCLCAPLSPILIDPLLAPFNSPAFALAGNATLSLPFVFFTQGLLRPIVRSAQNAQNPNITGFSNIAVRPSWNSTFDTASTAVVQSGMFLDEFTVAVYNIFNNIVSASLSSCDTLKPWSADGGCDRDRDTGQCRASVCEFNTVVQRGCCMFVSPTGSSQCARAVTENQCIMGLGGEWFAGDQCSVYPACRATVRPSTGEVAEYGCCAQNITNSPGGPTVLQATRCVDDRSPSECVGPDGEQWLHLSAFECSQLPGVTCLSQTPLATVATSLDRCGVGCTGALEDCTCTDCMCRYRVDPTPAIAGNNDEIVALGPCQAGTVPDPDTSTQQCRVEAPIDVPPPVPGFFTGLVYVTIDGPIIQPLRLFFNLLFNIDQVFTSLDGYLIWRVDSIGDSFKAGIASFDNLFDWLSRYVRALGEALATATEALEVAPLQNQLVQRAAQDLSFDERSQLDQAFSTAGDLIRFGFNAIATVVRVVGAFPAAVFTFIVDLLVFALDQVTGAIYFTVRSGIDDGVPDLFNYAKRTWGDFPDQTGLSYSCVLSTNPRLYTARINNVDAITCSERTELLEYCRFVFARAVAFREGNDAPTSVKPDYISIKDVSPNIVQSSQLCQFETNNCDVSLVLELTLPPQNTANSENKYAILLEGGVDVIRTLDPLLATLCPDCGVFNMFFSSFAQPLVPILLLPIDVTIHIANIFTSPYLACVDVQGALFGIDNFLTAITNLFRFVNEGITDDACLAGPAARDSRILCVIAQGIDATVDIVVQLVLFVWRIIQTLVRLAGSTLPAEALVELVIVGPIEIAIRTLVFDVVAIVSQAIPRSVTCVGPINANVGCCSILAPANAGVNPICVPRQTESSCQDLLTSDPFDLDGIAVKLNANQTCAEVSASIPFPCATSFLADNLFLVQYGCCKNTNDRSVLEARYCVDESLNIFEVTEPSVNLYGQCDGIGDTFYVGQTCAAAPGPQCPTTDPVQTVVAIAIASIIADVLILPLRVGLDLVIAFLNLFTADNVGDALTSLVEAVFEPIFVVISDTFIQLGRIFGCAGITELQDTFNLIATIVETILDVGLQILSALVLFVVYFIFGIIEAVTLFSFEILALAAQQLLTLLVALAFAIFGPTFVCGIQQATCAVVDGTNFLGVTDIPGDQINFAVDQCRIVDCCAPNDRVEPEDGSVSLCCIEDDEDVCDSTSIDSCSDVTRCPGGEPAPTKRKRASFRDAEARKSRYPNPLADFVRQELRNANRKAEPLDPAFCGAYIATLGMDAAKSGNDSTAHACLASGMSSPESTEAVVRRVIYANVKPMFEFMGTTRDAAYAHWHSMASEAHKHVAYKRKMRTLDFADMQQFEPAPKRYDMHALAERLHNHKLPVGRSRKIGHVERTKHRLVRRSIWEEHNMHIGRQLIVDTMTAAIRAHGAIVDAQEHIKLKQWIGAHFGGEVPPHLAGRVVDNRRKRSLNEDAKQLTHAQKVMLSMQVAASMAKDYYSRVGDALVKRVRAHLGVGSARPSQTSIDAAREASINLRLRQWRASPFLVSYENRFIEQDPRHQRALALGVPLASGSIIDGISNSTLEAFGLLPCNASAQSVCTGCLILDNLIGETEAAAEIINNAYGVELPKYTARFEEGISNTLEDPFGNDTYTSCPKRTPFVLERLLTVRWFWQWDYTEFFSIVSAGQTSESIDLYVDQTSVIQLERAAAVGREDYDNDVLALFGFLLQAPLNLLERAIGAVSGVDSTEVLINLYTRYVRCDYASALLCTSDLGIGLFDAIMNVLLVLTGVVIILSLILPGGADLLFMIISFGTLVLVGYFATLWIAYGASPLCTLPTLFAIPVPPMGFAPMGVPTCLFSDVNQLVAETFPQCPYTVPIILIEDAAFAEASTTLCASCGTAPPLKSCATFGFLNGLDNFFYITGSLFPPAFNEFIVTTVGSLVPSIGTAASLYTPAYIESLGEGGAVCNRILLPNLITAFAVTSLILAVLSIYLAFLAWFLIGVFWLYWVTLLAINEMILQMDKGFVNNTRVNKLKLKSE